MKAIVISQSGSAEVLALQQRPIPIINDDDVLIKVHAAGVNRPDIMQRQGKYPPPPGAPLDIPGLEVSGEIISVGSLVTRRKIGDKVCALVNGGGYAEYVVAHEGSCLPIPSGLSFIEAASLPETVFTVWHNVFERGNLKSGERFLVHGGSSGIGVTAIQLAKSFGATVIATVGSNEKKKACEELGANEVLNYNDLDFFLSINNVDVILDMIGEAYFNQNINCLNPDGRLVFINAMKGKLATANINQIMSQRLTITGSTLRPQSKAFKAKLAQEIEKHVWPIIERGEFKPVIFKTFSLENAAEAHLLMESSKHIGKIVLTLNH